MPWAALPAEPALVALTGKGGAVTCAASPDAVPVALTGRGVGADCAALPAATAPVEFKEGGRGGAEADTGELLTAEASGDSPAAVPLVVPFIGPPGFGTLKPEG